MPRFFIPPEQIQRNLFTLIGSEAWHAARVLRMKCGDTIDLFDGKDLSYQGQIESITSERVEGVILTQQKRGKSSPVDVILYQALLKGPKWDWLLEKACEIGVRQIVPILTQRTVVKTTDRDAHKQERWQKIALAASKQCGRSDRMDIAPVQKVYEAFQTEMAGCLSLIPWEKESDKSIHQACQGFKDHQTRLFIGPEGGWATEEVDYARRHNIIPVRLGPTLLRSETAGLVAATLILSELGVYS